MNVEKNGLQFLFFEIRKKLNKGRFLNELICVLERNKKNVKLNFCKNEFFADV